MRINKKNTTAGNNQFTQNSGQNFNDQNNSVNTIHSHHHDDNAYQSLSQTLEDFDDLDYIMQDDDIDFENMHSMDGNSVEQLYGQHYHNDYDVNSSQHDNMYSYPNYNTDIQYYNNENHESQTQTNTTSVNIINKSNKSNTSEDLLKKIVQHVNIEPDQSSQTSIEENDTNVYKKRKLDNNISYQEESQVSPVPTSSNDISQSEYDRLSINPVATRVEPTIENLSQKNKKNAIQARINRQRKKNELQLLESRVSSLESVNSTLNSDNIRLTKEHKEMSEELQYLRNILRNQSKISDVIKGIGNVTDVVISHKYNSSGIKQDTSAIQNLMGSGICVHVDSSAHDQKVSLEFCRECSKSAQISTK